MKQAIINAARRVIERASQTKNSKYDSSLFSIDCFTGELSHADGEAAEAGAFCQLETFRSGASTVKDLLRHALETLQDRQASIKAKIMELAGEDTYKAVNDLTDNLYCFELITRTLCRYEEALRG